MSLPALTAADILVLLRIPPRALADYLVTMDSGFRRYQIIFTDHAGAQYGSDTLVALDDAVAVEQARKRYRMGIGAGYEIWHGDRLVHTERFGP